MQALQKSTLALVLLTGISQVSLSHPDTGEAAYGLPMTGNEAWSYFQENHTDNLHIPDFSYAGYKGGRVPVPDVPVVVTFTDFGSQASSPRENSEAIERAMLAAWHAGGGAIFFPEGTYRFDRMIHMKWPGVVLRGEGKGLTRLRFTESLEGSLGRPITGSGSTYWSWENGLILLSPEDTLGWNVKEGRLEREIVQNYRSTGYNSHPDKWKFWWGGINSYEGHKLTSVVGSTPRGTTAIEVAETANLTVGNIYMLCWRNGLDSGIPDPDGGNLPGDLSLMHTIAGHPLMENYDWTWSGARVLYRHTFVREPVEIIDITGTIVTLSKPIPLDIRPEWDVQLQEIGPYISESGIEHLTLETDADIAAVNLLKHNRHMGWNGIAMVKAINCWVRNVELTNFENGIFTASVANISISDFDMLGETHVHHGFNGLDTRDLLFENFRFENPFIRHGLSVQSLSRNTVFRNGLMERGTFDSHRIMPFDMLMTNLVMRNTGHPGGDRDFGPARGRGAVHWNIQVTGTDPQNSDNKLGEFVNQPNWHSYGAVVGVQGVPQSTEEPWGVAWGDKNPIIGDVDVVPEIPDLFLQQLAFRKERESWVDISYPNTIASPGAIDVEAYGNPSADRTIQNITLYVNDALVGSDATAPYSITWESAPAGRHKLKLAMLDSEGETTWSPEKRLVVGYQERVENTDPNITYTGSKWKESTGGPLQPFYSGGSQHESSGDKDASVTFSFEGTRIVLYVNYLFYKESTNSTFTPGIKPTIELNGLPSPIPPNAWNVASQSKIRYKLWDSGELPAGLHTFRMTGVNTLAVDYFEVTRTPGAVLNVQAPVISPEEGSFIEETEVNMTSEQGADIRYTLDGSTPGPGSILYTGPFALNQAGETTINAVAILDGEMSLFSSAVLNIVREQAPDEIITLASGFQDPNKPGNTVDGDLTTRWSMEGQGEWIEFIFARPRTLEAVEIAFFNSDQRTASFDILGATEGGSYSPLLENVTSNGITPVDQFESFALSPTPIQFIRLVGKGNSVNNWNSINEVRFVFTEDPSLQLGMSYANGRITISWNGDPGSDYTVERSNDMQKWSDHHSGVTPADGECQFEETFDHSAPIFYRIKTSQSSFQSDCVETGLGQFLMPIICFALSMHR